MLYRQFTILVNIARLLSLSCLVYSLQLSVFQEPHAFISSIEFSSAQKFNKLGIAALNECPVIVWFSSTKSDNSSESHRFILPFVRNFPDLKVNTGFLGS